MPTVDYQICLAKSSAAAETWISLRDLGASDPHRSLIVGGLDTVIMRVNSATALTDPAAFAYKAVVRLRKVVDGTPSYWFCGRVMTVPRKGSGSGESQTLRIEGPWSWFETCTYRQAWAGRSTPRVILYCDADGGRITTGAQIADAVAFARAAGCPIAATVAGDIATGFSPPFDEQVNIKVADVICNALAMHPHAACWVDYSQREPRFRVAQRQSLPPVSLDIAGRHDIDITARPDQQATAIAIAYERVTTVDGDPAYETVLDHAPVVSGESDAARDTRLAQDDVIWAVYNLQGETVTTASQLIEAADWPVSLADKAWFKARVPWLQEIADADISIGNARRMHDSTLANLLVSGVRQPWLPASIETERVCADIAYIKRAVIDGVSTVIEQSVKAVTVEVEVTGAAVGQTLYRCPLSVDEGEPTPAGIAAALYAEWSQLHHEGKIEISGADNDGSAVPGRSLNLTGGLAEWASMAAMIKRVDENADTGDAVIEFGVPDWIDVDARVAFARATRIRRPAASRVWRTGFTASGVTGPVTPATRRESNVDAAFTRQVFAANSTPRHMVIVDADGIVKSTDTSAAAVIRPREVIIPYQDGGAWKGKLAQVLASAPYGDALDLASPLATEAPEAVGALSAVGTATRAAREDHVHTGVQLSDADPQPLGAAADAGNAIAAARADHVHAGTSGPDLSDSSPPAVGSSGSAGAAASAARGDHTHALTLGAPFVFASGALDLRTDFVTAHPNAVFGYHYDPSLGTSWGFFIHRSILPAEESVDPTPKKDTGIGNVGSIGLDVFAHHDHAHPLNVSSSNPADISATSSPGSSDTYARSDHVHKGPSLSAATPQSDTGAGSAGSATDASKSDHRHPLNVDTATPGDCGPSAASAGSAGVYARRDHTHRVTCAMPGGLTPVQMFPSAATSTSPDGNTFDAATFLALNRYAILRRVTRIVFNTAATPPTLLEFFQTETVLPSGQIVSISAEQVRTIATTVAHA